MIERERPRGRSRPVNTVSFEEIRHDIYNYLKLYGLPFCTILKNNNSGKKIKLKSEVFILLKRQLHTQSASIPPHFLAKCEQVFKISGLISKKNPLFKSVKQ